MRIMLNNVVQVSSCGCREHLNAAGRSWNFHLKFQFVSCCFLKHLSSMP